MVSSKCSCSLSPLLLCLCLLKRNQVSNLDQTAVTNRALARINMTIVLSADTAWPVMPYVCHLSCGRTLAGQHFAVFILYPWVFFVLFKAATTSVIFSLSVWLYHPSVAWNEICVCSCQCICALLYLHSRNASNPPNSSRRTKHTTAAVVPLAPVSQGAVNQEKDTRSGGGGEHNIGHGCPKRAKRSPETVCTVTKLTGKASANRWYPKIPWLSLDHHASLSHLFSSHGSSINSSNSRDLLIPLWKILYDWNNIQFTEQSAIRTWLKIDTSHTINESDFWICMTQHGQLTLNKTSTGRGSFSSNQLS